MQPLSSAQCQFTLLLLQGIPDDWYVKETTGNPPSRTSIRLSVPEHFAVWPGCGWADLCLPICWRGWREVLPSGLWDGVFFDNFFAEANIHIRNLSNPALLDFDLTATEFVTRHQLRRAT